MPRLPPILLYLLTCSAIGCGSHSPVPSPKQGELAPGGAEDARSTDWTIKHYAIEELTATEDEFLIDDGRVEVAPPKDWKRLPRSDKYLVCFTHADRAGLPRITVTSEAFSSSVFENVTSDNLVDFGKFRLEALSGGDEPAKLIEAVRPLQLGETTWIRYVVAASFANAAAEKQILETVHEGKLYRIELQVAPETLTVHRDAAYAVAAKMRFIEADAAPPTTETPTEPIPTPPPTEGAP